MWVVGFYIPLQGKMSENPVLLLKLRHAKIKTLNNFTPVQEVQSREQPRPHAHFPLPLSLFLPPNSIKRSVFLLFLLTFNLCKYPLESHILTLN